MSFNIVPVILAGGEGRRLRPLTSYNRPKPFLKLFSRHSLFQKTALRLFFASAPVVVVHERHKKIVEQQLAEIDVVPNMIVTEPEYRSTAPAIALAALNLQALDNDAVMLVTPSDHYIQDTGVLRNVILKAADYVQTKEAKFVSIGAAPDKPATRFGYISYDDGFNIVNFKEKPDKQTAKSYIAKGNCAWNTGMFLCRPIDYLEALNEHRPEILNAVKDNENYAKCPSEAVDTAIMENITGAKLALLKTNWRDLGVLPEFMCYFLCNKS